jgi:hypothetical protein
MVDNILKEVRHACNRFVAEAKKEIKAIPDDEAAEKNKIYEATLNSPALKAEEESDPPGQDVKQGMEDEMLETQGAPVTGALQAETLAMRMMGALNAGMVHEAVSPEDREEKLNRAKSAPQKDEIPEASKDLEMDGEIKNDGAQRERAKSLNGAGDS